MAPNFSSLLNKPVSDVQRPVALPDGSYYAVIKGHEMVESGQKKTPGVQFNLELTHAHEDTDTEGLDERIPGKKMRNTFWVTDESLYRLTDFLGSCGVDLTGKTLGEVIPQVTGSSVLVDVVKKPNEREEGEYYNEVRKIVGLEAAAAEPSEEQQIEEAQGRRRRS